MNSTPKPNVTMGFLRSHTLFANVPDDDLRVVAEFLREEQFKAGEDIILEGDTGECLYVITRGSVEVLKKVFAKEGLSLERIAVLSRGETFGEMEFVDSQPRSATVRALEDTHVLALTGEAIFQAADRNARTISRIIMNIAREMSVRLRKTDAYFAGSLFCIRKS